MAYNPMKAIATAIGVDFEEYFTIENLSKYTPAAEGKSNIFRLTDDGLEVKHKDTRTYFVPNEAVKREIFYNLARGKYTTSMCALKEAEYYILKAYSSGYEFVVKSMTENKLLMFNGEFDPEMCLRLEAPRDLTFSKISEDTANPSVINALIKEYETLY